MWGVPGVGQLLEWRARKRGWFILGLGTQGARNWLGGSYTPVPLPHPRDAAVQRAEADPRQPHQLGQQAARLYLLRPRGWEARVPVRPSPSPFTGGGGPGTRLKGFSQTHTPGLSYTWRFWRKEMRPLPSVTTRPAGVGTARPQVEEEAA